MVSGTVNPAVSLPMVICCGRLVVVSSNPPGDLFFVFWANLLFLGADRRVTRGFGGVEKTNDGYIPMGPKNIPKRQKPRSWHETPPTCDPPRGHSGALFGAYGQIRAAVRGVNLR